jgi:hypothetical protein
MPLSISFYPGHNKWDYAYSIGELHPDVVAQLWARPEEATPYLEEGYRAVVIDELTFYYLEHSEHVHWNNLDQYIRSGP